MNKTNNWMMKHRSVIQYNHPVSKNINKMTIKGHLGAVDP